MRPFICAGVGVCLAGALLGVSPARAAELFWSAPEDCSRDSFVYELEKSTEERLVDLPVELLEVRVLRDGPTRWTATFALREAPGGSEPTRRIRGSSCVDVGRATAVAIALALHRAAEEPDSEMGWDAQTDTKENLEVEAGETSTLTAPDRAVVTNPPEASGLAPRFGLLASVLVNGPLLGQTTLGVGLGGFVGFDRLELGVRGGVLTPTELRITETLGVRLAGYLLDVDGCFVVLERPVSLRACLGYQLAVVQGEGTGSGLEMTRRQIAYWHALQPAASVALLVGQGFELRISSGAAIALARAVFVYDAGQRHVHELPAVSGQGALSVAWVR